MRRREIEPITEQAPASGISLPVVGRAAAASHE